MVRSPPDKDTKLSAFTFTKLLCIACVGFVWLAVLSSLAFHKQTHNLHDGLETTTSQEVVGEPEQHQGNAAGATKRLPTIVLSTGGGLWNTGVWSGYGGRGQKVVLDWASKGIVVDKSPCPHRCLITHNQRQIDSADAVVMEVVNHAKFLGPRARKVAFPFPKRHSPRHPLFVAFYFEPFDSHPELDDSELMEHFDATMAPTQLSEIPLTFTCPWGRPITDYFNMPNLNNKKHLIAYFNEHGVADKHKSYISRLTSQLGDRLYAFQTHKNRDMPAEAADPNSRIDYLSQFHFVLVTEWMIEDDWVEKEFSQAILAGAVPVYFGAPNIASHAPGAESFIDGSQYLDSDPSVLVKWLEGEVESSDAYLRHFEWRKKKVFPANFKEKLDNCVFYAECRLCKTVLDHLDKDG